MNSETAKQLLQEGGTLIALNVPTGTEFGIDMKQWTTGENFRGVKMIPPGLHFIHYSATDQYGGIAPKVGYFHNFKKSEFLLKRWDDSSQDLKSSSQDEQEIVNFKDNMVALDKFLGPYPYDIWHKWVGLTSHVTESLVDKLSPESGQIRSALDLESCSDADRPRKSAQSTDEPSCSTSTNRQRKSYNFNEGDDLLPNLKPFPGTELRLTKFPDQNYPSDATPAEVTQHSLDSSYALETMFAQHSQDVDLIGELQFAYVCFLIGQSLDAFEHWKKLVSLLCSCDAAIKRHRAVYDLFITTLEAQILETPEEFLADIVSNNNLIYIKLRELFRTVRSGDVDGRLKTKIERFKRNLSTTYQWDFSHLDSEDEDEAPVIVET